MKKVLFLMFISVQTLFSQIDPGDLILVHTATTSEMNALTPAKGALIYNTDNDKVYQFTGAVWKAIEDDSDWTRSGNDLVSVPSGNVGIGNPAPATKLDVSGSIHTTDALNIGPNASGARLSITDDNYPASMLDIQTDDQGPWAFRILNNSYSQDLSNAFRIYQSNNGQVNMSVGALSHRFFTINEQAGNGLGGIGVGSDTHTNTLLNINRGSKDLGQSKFMNQRNYVARKGNLSGNATTFGIENIVVGSTTGGSATYYGTRNTVRVDNAHNFHTLFGNYNYVYNKSTAQNPNSSIYGNYSVAYGRSDGGTKYITGAYTRAAKTEGAGNVTSIIGHQISCSKTQDNIGQVKYITGSHISVFGASDNQTGQSISLSSFMSNPTNMTGSSIRLYGRTGYQPKSVYGLNINTNKYESEPTDAIYNINVTSKGNTSLPQNIGARFYLRDGIDNYGLYVDVKDATNTNFALYAKNGQSYFADNVGIGTTTPRSKLDVDGILTEGKNKSMYGTSPYAGSCVVSHGIASFFTYNNDNNYIHIKLPYKIDTDAHMYHIHATGYRYRSGKVIDITWVGYCYAPTQSLIEKSHINAGSPEFEITEYVGSDKHIYLRFRGTTGTNYYESFRIDSMNVGNGTVLKEGDVEIISSPSPTL